MNKKLKQARANLLEAAKEIDRISKCYHAKEKKAMTTIVKTVINNSYRY
ncbi:MAG: hypothetical protein KJ706_05800 [Candidatus Omnitrophica bacterium]|nr:hypothetical protein [Candidatus Omnitrophota bacterium]